MDEAVYWIIFTTILVIGILSLIGLAVFGAHISAIKKYDNFQITITDLNDEQKCLHICGFQYPSGYFDQYKFCVEKCDRISERTMKCENGQLGD